MRRAAAESSARAANARGENRAVPISRSAFPCAVLYFLSFVAGAGGGGVALGADVEAGVEVDAGVVPAGAVIGAAVAPDSGTVTGAVDGATGLGSGAAIFGSAGPVDVACRCS